MTLERKPQNYDSYHYDLQIHHTPTQTPRIYVESNKVDLNIVWQEILRLVNTKDRGCSRAGGVLDYCEAVPFPAHKTTKGI